MRGGSMGRKTIILCLFFPVTTFTFNSSFAGSYHPTTTYSEQTGNNTSASSSFATLKVPVPHHASEATVLASENGDAAPGNVSKISIHTLAPAGFEGKFFAHYIPWWGSRGYWDIGYSSEDPTQIANTVDDMKSRGYDGVVLAEANTVTDNEASLTTDVGFDRTAATMMAIRASSEGMSIIASENHLSFSADETVGRNVLTNVETLSGLTVGTSLAGAGIPAGTTVTALHADVSIFPPVFSLTMSSNATSDGAHTIDDASLSRLENDMAYFNANYFYLPNYYRVNGRPVVMVFDDDAALDWDSISANAAYGNPVFIHRNRSALSNPSYFGAFSWFSSISTTDPYGVGYLDEFYKDALSLPTQFAAGDYWKGFNDTLAPWTRDRIIPQHCGQTWLKTLATIPQNFSKHLDSLPIVEAATWNDYEEGTEVETGIDNCASVKAWLSDKTLNFAPSFSSDGSENTVDHYEIYASLDGIKLMLLTELPAVSRTFYVGNLGLPPGPYKFFVKMVGKPNILNHMSPHAVTISLASPQSNGISIISPTSGSEVNSPVKVVANFNEEFKISQILIWDSASGALVEDIHIDATHYHLNQSYALPSDGVSHTLTFAVLDSNLVERDVSGVTFETK